MSKSQALQEFKQELHISHSQIFVYLNCSLKYQFMYVECRPPERLSVALPFGSAIHTGIEWYYRSLKDKGSLKPLKDLEELFCDSLSLEIDHSDIPIIYKKEAPDKDSAIELGKRLLKVFYESVDLTGKEIIDVELPLSAKLYTPEGEATELNLIGVLDLVLICFSHCNRELPYGRSPQIEDTEDGKLFYGEDSIRSQTVCEDSINGIGWY